MAKKEFNAQDNSAKNPECVNGVYKIVEQNRSDKPHSDKGFTNTITCPYVVDVAKRYRLERIVDKAQVAVLMETPEGWVLFEKNNRTSVGLTLF